MARSIESFLPYLQAAPDDSFERRARSNGALIVAGVDEAGRGPLAGPVVVAAVCFAGRRFPRGLNDSKKLSQAQREDLFEKILASGMVAVAVASARRIDEMNILRASLWAMSRAVAALALPPDHVLVDGRDIPDGLLCPAEALIGGDGRSVSIAAASIVAKVTRDRMMDRLGAAFPAYGFERHKGYPTRAHFLALEQYGASIHHRRSFAPVSRRIEQGSIEKGPDGSASAVFQD